jgi:hypothetical protein
MLTDAQIQKFQQLYLNRFGENIGRERATELGTRLINMMKTIYQPISAQEIELSERS